MTVRDMKPEDIPALLKMYAEAPFDYQFPDLEGPLMETVKVVVNEKDEPIGAAAVERLVQVYSLLSPDLEASAKLFVLSQLQDACIPELKEKGYTDCNGFIPPEIFKSFSRRMLRTLGWTKNWPSLNRKF